MEEEEKTSAVSFEAVTWLSSWTMSVSRPMRRPEKLWSRGWGGRGRGEGDRMGEGRRVSEGGEGGGGEGREKQ